MPSGVWYGLLSQRQKEDVLELVAEEAAHRLEVYIDALTEALGLRELVGTSKLDAYRGRPPETWAALRTEFPDAYETQMRDWRRLETAELRRGYTRGPTMPTMPTAPTTAPPTLSPSESPLPMPSF